jgi:hypothetical protein
VGVLSGYGRMFHMLAGGVDGVEVCGRGVAWGMSGLWSEESEVGSELVVSGSVVGVGGLRTQLQERRAAPAHLITLVRGRCMVGEGLRR